MRRAGGPAAGRASLDATRRRADGCDGLVVGVACAISLNGFVANLLYGVTAGDLVTYAGVVALLGGVALIASYLLARRVSRVDPMDRPSLVSVTSSQGSATPTSASAEAHRIPSPTYFLERMVPVA